ncbi:MAG TPA: ATP-binding protein [Steroidobacteraceae bacterium]|jgi:signal transduction histidine kinase|nr:ATP-binding protein [Steroidobacteraceae bacterium]
MARLRTSFANFVAVCVVALHLVLLPALYYGLGYVVRKSHEDLFIEHARTFARVLADEFELGVALESESRTEDLLDLAIVHGDGRYAELTDGARSVRSKLGSPNIKAPRHTDLTFGEGDDDIYFVVLPIVHAGRNAELRLGFDEQPTLERIHLALNRMLVALAVYFGVAMVIAVILSHRLSRPIHRLQDVSRSIASGDYAQALQIATGIRELHELAADLDNMRRELVGVNDRLQAKIREKEISEIQREELQKQLRHRQRLETVGTLAGGIAHEFNNVLVPIILFTEMALQDLPGSSVSRSDLERVLTAAQRAKDVVKKILTFSRELGDVKLALIDLRTVIADGLHLFAALAPPSVEIRTEIDDAIPPVRADATLAVHLVINLCTNAYQAMQGTQGILTIGLRNHGNLPLTGESGAFVEFWVSDTGHGMDSATAERIFEPFFTTRSVGVGTGLGLSVVHGIVESFGAKIVVETEPGKGSTFRIYFPAVLQQDRPLEPIAPVA